jgi:sensor c-di-GMP phosphodiesterase-like protein
MPIWRCTRPRIRAATCIAFYNRSIHDLSLQRLEIGRCLRGALERQELHVVYHPLVRADSGCIIGAEALVALEQSGIGRGPAVYLHSGCRAEWA